MFFNKKTELDEMNRETITHVVQNHFHVKINDILSRVRKKKQIASAKQLIWNLQIKTR